VGKLHWLILVPYYFFGAITLLGVLVFIARVLRLKVLINALVITAILVTMASLAIPLIAGWVGISSLTGFGVALLLLASFLLAALDTLISKALPLPLDEELTAEH
jgi:hypothetical protein